MNPARRAGGRSRRRAAYLSYLVRLWRVHAGGAPVWRASAQRPGLAEQVALESVEDVLAFLRAETARSDEQETAEPEAPME